MTKKPKDYESTHGVEYEQPDRQGYLCISVLEFLRGQKWDEVALGYVNALRPSSIRVTKGECTCDARTWRVTVHVNFLNRIERIEQEVVVGLPKEVTHGHALSHALKFGLDSEQVKWHQDVEGYVAGMGQFGKTDSKGNYVPFPKTIEQALMERKEVLPLLVGIHPDLDKRIEKALKEN